MPQPVDKITKKTARRTVASATALRPHHTSGFMGHSNPTPLLFKNYAGSCGARTRPTSLFPKYLVGVAHRATGAAPLLFRHEKGRCVIASSLIGLAQPIRNWLQFKDAMKSFTSVSEMYFCSSIPPSEKVHVTAGADTSPFLSNCTLPVAP